MRHTGAAYGRKSRELRCRKELCVSTMMVTEGSQPHDRRKNATKVLAVRMLQGYKPCDERCRTCDVPLMTFKGSTSCVVCPTITIHETKSPSAACEGIEIEIARKPVERSANIEERDDASINALSIKSVPMESAARRDYWAITHCNSMMPQKRDSEHGDMPTDGGSKKNPQNARFLAILQDMAEKAKQVASTRDKAPPVNELVQISEDIENSQKQNNSDANSQPSEGEETEVTKNTAFVRVEKDGVAVSAERILEDLTVTRSSGSVPSQPCDSVPTDNTLDDENYFKAKETNIKASGSSTKSADHQNLVGTNLEEDKKPPQDPEQDNNSTDIPGQDNNFSDIPEQVNYCIESSEQHDDGSELPEQSNTSVEPPQRDDHSPLDESFHQVKEVLDTPTSTESFVSNGRSDSPSYQCNDPPPDLVLEDEVAKSSVERSTLSCSRYGTDISSSNSSVTSKLSQASRKTSSSTNNLSRESPKPPRRFLSINRLTAEGRRTENVADRKLYFSTWERRLPTSSEINEQYFSAKKSSQPHESESKSTSGNIVASETETASNETLTASADKPLGTDNFEKNDHYVLSSSSTIQRWRAANVSNTPRDTIVPFDEKKAAAFECRQKCKAPQPFDEAKPTKHSARGGDICDGEYCVARSGFIASEEASEAYVSKSLKGSTHEANENDNYLKDESTRDSDSNCIKCGDEVGSELYVALSQASDSTENETDSNSKNGSRVAMFRSDDDAVGEGEHNLYVSLSGVSNTLSSGVRNTIERKDEDDAITKNAATISCDESIAKDCSSSIEPLKANRDGNKDSPVENEAIQIPDFIDGGEQVASKTLKQCNVEDETFLDTVAKEVGNCNDELENRKSNKRDVTAERLESRSVSSADRTLASISSRVERQAKRIAELEAEARRKHEEAEEAATRAREAFEQMIHTKAKRGKIVYRKQAQASASYVSKCSTLDNLSEKEEPTEKIDSGPDTSDYSIASTLTEKSEYDGSHVDSKKIGRSRRFKSRDELSEGGLLSTVLSSSSTFSNDDTVESESVNGITASIKKSGKYMPSPVKYNYQKEKNTKHEIGCTGASIGGQDSKDHYNSVLATGQSDQRRRSRSLRSQIRKEFDDNTFDSRSLRSSLVSKESREYYFDGHDTFLRLSRNKPNETTAISRRLTRAHNEAREETRPSDLSTRKPILEWRQRGVTPSVNSASMDDGSFDEASYRYSNAEKFKYTELRTKAVETFSTNRPQTNAENGGRPNILLPSLMSPPPSKDTLKDELMYGGQRLISFSPQDLSDRSDRTPPPSTHMRKLDHMMHFSSRLDLTQKPTPKGIFSPEDRPNRSLYYVTSSKFDNPSLSRRRSEPDLGFPLDRIAREMNPASKQVNTKLSKLHQTMAMRQSLTPKGTHEQEKFQFRFMNTPRFESRNIESISLAQKTTARERMAFQGRAPMSPATRLESDYRPGVSHTLRRFNSESDAACTENHHSRVRFINCYDGRPRQRSDSFVRPNII